MTPKEYKQWLEAKRAELIKDAKEAESENEYKRANKYWNEAAGFQRALDKFTEVEWS